MVGKYARRKMKGDTSRELEHGRARKRVLVGFANGGTETESKGTLID